MEALEEDDLSETDRERLCAYMLKIVKQDRIWGRSNTRLRDREKVVRSEAALS
jgi:hypothetical protein